MSISTDEQGVEAGRHKGRNVGEISPCGNRRGGGESLPPPPSSQHTLPYDPSLRSSHESASSAKFPVILGFIFIDGITMLGQQSSKLSSK